MTLPLVLLNRRRIGGFNPRAILAGSTAIAWFDPSDLPTLFQDAAGTTPVTAPAQPVGLVLDKSQGLVLGPELVTNGDFSNGTTGWTAGNSSTISVTSGVAQVAQTSSNLADIRQTLTTVAGRTYRVSCEIASQNGASIVAVAQDTSTFAVIQQSVAVTSATVTTVSFVFTANAATTRIAVRFNASGASGNTFTTDNISVRELPGFHATQSTAANRPTYGVVPSRGRVNLLTFSEAFDNAAWTKTSVSVSAAGAYWRVVGANGVTNTWAGNGYTVSTNGQSQTISIVAKADAATYMHLGRGGNGVWFNLSTGATMFSTSGFTGSASAPDADGARRYSVTFTETALPNGSATQVRVYPSVNAPTSSDPTSGGGNDGVKGILVNNAQLELGSTASPYQRVVSQFEVTDPAGFPSYPLHYLFFGGDLDPRWLQTSTITPSADKVQVFAGVRKLSDAATGMLLETGVGGIGTIYVTAPNAPNQITFRTGGTTLVPVNATLTGSVPFVVSGIGDIANDVSRIRINGGSDTTSSGDQGTGNYAAQPLYIGRRGGTSLAFNGQLYGLIVRFSTANLDAELISQTERWLAQKTWAFSVWWGGIWQDEYTWVDNLNWNDGV